MARGIGYGMRTTNVDAKTGIRYGVLPQNDILQAWADSSEPYYGDPHCSKCGSAARPIEDIHADCDEDWTDDHDIDNLPEGWEREPYEEAEFYCERCKRVFGSESAYGYETMGFTLEDSEYSATCGEDGDIFILRSPYFTRAQFCSPCAPGACYLRNPCPDGARAYCFGTDWFESDIVPCPYPVYRVSDGVLIYSPTDTETQWPAIDCDR